MIQIYEPKARDLKPLVATSRRLLDGGKNLEAVLRYLRDSGCHMSESISVTVALTGMARGDAKRAVVESATWSDHREATELLHTLAEEVIADTEQTQANIDAVDDLHPLNTKGGHGG